MTDLYELCAPVPAKLLRARAKPVEWGPETEALARRLVGLVGRAQGCLGLAAPQIGESVRIIAVNLSGLGVVAMLNPEIAGNPEKARPRMRLEEGCYSIGRGNTVFCMRAARVEVSFDAVKFNRRGDASIERVEGMTFERLSACVLQHEVDHLDGILISQRARQAA